MLRGWDYRWSLDSKPTSLAVFWGDALLAPSAPAAKQARLSVWDYMAERTSDTQKLAALSEASHRVWGSLASFAARRYPGTRCYYGTDGNSFVAVVEFGPKVRAWGVGAGGESGHPGSPHFFDQAQRYADGNLRKIYFYPADLEGHIEKRYHPGE